MSASEESAPPAGRASVDRAAFVRTGVVPDSVREEVAGSWRRSTRLGAETVPDLPRPPQAVSAPCDLDILARRLAGLTASRTLVLDGTFLLLDAGVRVLGRWSADPGGSEGLQTVLGSCVGEPSIGTSAVALAVRAGATRQVVGAEHLLPELTRWTSTAGPLHDETGGVLGYVAAFERVATATLTPALLGLVVSLLELEARRAA